MLDNANKVCIICNKALSPLESLAGEVCSNVNCRTRFLSLQRARDEAARKSRVEALQGNIALSYKKQLKDSKKTELELPLFTLPATDSDVVAFSQSDKKAFLFFLVKMFRIAKSKSYASEKDKRGKTFSSTKIHLDLQTNETEFTGKLCGICRGYCCQQGEVYGYITPTQIRNILSKVRGMTARRLYQEYKRYLPEKHVSNSCVYHSENGCVLPSNRRSNICNQFFCKESAELIKKLREQPVKNIFVVAKNNKYIVRKKLLKTFQD